MLPKPDFQRVWILTSKNQLNKPEITIIVL